MNFKHEIPSRTDTVPNNGNQRVTWINNKGSIKVASSALALNTAEAASSINAKKNNNKKTVIVIKSNIRLLQINLSWTRTKIQSLELICGAVPLLCGVILQAVARCQAQMKSDAFSLVDKSTVNRDHSVAQTSSNVKPDLVSQMHHCMDLWTIYRVTKAQTQCIKAFIFSHAGTPGTLLRCPRSRLLCFKYF